MGKKMPGERVQRLGAMIGSAARSARLRTGLTQADLAEQLDLAVEVYGRLERGQMLPSVPTLHQLCVSLGLSADEVLGFLPEGGARRLQPPPVEESPEVRRVSRQLSRLNRRKLQLLGALVRLLARSDP
jgi:transcriptional regulator with XRE-family HTH domain